MHGRSAIWFPLALLALLATLSFWIERVVQPPQPKRDGSSRHDPDYSMNNFVANKFDASGRLVNTLAATGMVHFPDDDSTELTRPRFTQFAPDKPTMQIEGQRGTVAGNGKTVDFYGSVKFVRAASKDQGMLTVLSEAMHIQPDDDIISADKPVRIMQAPRTIATANSMEFNNKLRILKLTRNVRVHYERQRISANAAGSITPKTKPVAIAKTMSKPRTAAAKNSAAAKKLPQTNAKNNKPVAASRTNKNAASQSSKSKTTKPKAQNSPAQSNTRIRRKYDTPASH